MKKDRFEYLCSEAEGGRDAFARHAATNAEGVVVSCLATTGHLVVRTPDNRKHCWSFKDCEELSHPKSGPMI